MTFDISNQSWAGGHRGQGLSIRQKIIFLSFSPESSRQTQHFTSFQRSELPSAKTELEISSPAGAASLSLGGRVTGLFWDSKILLLRSGNVLLEFFLEPIKINSRQLENQNSGDNDQI